MTKDQFRNLCLISADLRHPPPPPLVLIRPWSADPGAPAQRPPLRACCQRRMWCENQPTLQRVTLLLPLLAASFVLAGRLYKWWHLSCSIIAWCFHRAPREAGNHSLISPSPSPKNTPALQMTTEVSAAAEVQAESERGTTRPPPLLGLRSPEQRHHHVGDEAAQLELSASVMCPEPHSSLTGDKN